MHIAVLIILHEDRYSMESNAYVLFIEVKINVTQSIEWFTRAEMWDKMRQTGGWTRWTILI